MFQLYTQDKAEPSNWVAREGSLPMSQASPFLPPVLAVLVLVGLDTPAADAVVLYCESAFELVRSIKG